MEKLLEENDIFATQLDVNLIQYGQKWQVIQAKMKKMISRQGFLSDHNNHNQSSNKHTTKSTKSKSAYKKQSNVITNGQNIKDETDEQAMSSSYHFTEKFSGKRLDGSYYNVQKKKNLKNNVEQQKQLMFANSSDNQLLKSKQSLNLLYKEKKNVQRGQNNFKRYFMGRKNSIQDEIVHSQHSSSNQIKDYLKDRQKKYDFHKCDKIKEFQYERVFKQPKKGLAIKFDKKQQVDRFNFKKYGSDLNFELVSEQYKQRLQTQRLVNQRIQQLEQQINIKRLQKNQKNELNYKINEQATDKPHPKVQPNSFCQPQPASAYRILQKPLPPQSSLIHPQIFGYRNDIYLTKQPTCYSVRNRIITQGSMLKCSNYMIISSINNKKKNQKQNQGKSQKSKNRQDNLFDNKMDIVINAARKIKLSDILKGRISIDNTNKQSHLKQYQSNHKNYNKIRSVSCQNPNQANLRFSKLTLPSVKNPIYRLYNQISVQKLQACSNLPSQDNKSPLISRISRCLTSDCHVIPTQYSIRKRLFEQIKAQNQKLPLLIIRNDLGNDKIINQYQRKSRENRTKVKSNTKGKLQTKEQEFGPYIKGSQLRNSKLNINNVQRKNKSKLVLIRN